MECDFCGQGRPKLFNKDGKFCDVLCYQGWKDKLNEVTLMECPNCKRVYPTHVPNDVVNMKTGQVLHMTNRVTRCMACGTNLQRRTRQRILRGS